MAKLSRLADVQIALRTTAITERSFSDMMILGTHMLSINRAMVITSADELLDLGLESDDPLYIAASNAFAQIPAVRQVYIGRRQVDDVNIRVTDADEKEYRVTLQWRDASGSARTQTAVYLGLGMDDEDDIATALAMEINGTDADVTAVATGAAVAVTNDVSGAPMRVTVSGDLSIDQLSSSESVTDALAAVNSEMGNWYGLVLTSRVEQDVKDAAAWAEANEKLFGTASSDPDIIDSGSTSDIASFMMEKQYFRTFVFYSAQAGSQYPEAAIMSSMFTYYAGSENWSLKKMAGIAYDALSEGQAITAHGKNANTFEMFRNFAVTQNGKTAGGEWIDVIRLRDQLVESIKVSVVSTMINADGKIPYTDTGIQIVVNAIRSPLDLNVRRGGIAPEELDEDNKVIPSYTISYPRSSQVPFNDKANRVLNDVKFTARLAGAINLVVIRGSLSYEL